jgi:hypothetical protein
MTPAPSRHDPPKATDAAVYLRLPARTGMRR